MPFSEYHYPFENKQVFESRFPAQFVAEYIAQTRAWFYVMHVISQILFGKAPFENVVTTGTILAEDGSKMSKSKNNYPDPWEVINKYGVDALRFYLMNSVVMQADNLNFSSKDLENMYRKVVLILWNVQQYFLTYAPKEGLTQTKESTHVLDRWIVARTKELVNSVTDNLDGYNTVHATRAITEFIDDLSTWYLRRSRGREDTGFFPTFHSVLMTTAKVIAPIMPHLAEAIYRDLRTEADSQSVHLTAWPAKENLSAEEKTLLQEMKVAREGASAVMAIRKDKDKPVRQPLAQGSMTVKRDRQLPSDILAVVREEINVEDIVSIKIVGPNTAESVTPTGTIVVLNMELTPELEIKGETRKLERAIQEKRRDMGMKVGEMARLTYFADNASTEAAFKAVDIKKTYISESKKGAGGASGTFELERG
jgi:isoleucyl-tRNA synthetase